MADKPSEDKKANSETPAPETLETTDESSGSDASGNKTLAVPVPSPKRRRGSYRPSHKATFIGLAVIVAILALNAGIIMFLLKNQSKNTSSLSKSVSISQSALSKLGVNSTPVGDAGIVVNIGPNTDFGGNIQVAGSATIGGQLILNQKLSAPDASFTKLAAGNTSLSQLNVNGDGTLSNLSLRQNITAAGNLTVQGNAIFSHLMTVNNNLNVVGSLAVGGSLNIANFVTSNLTLGGHLITAGNAPGVSRGSGLNSADTVTISGDDASGTVAVNVGYNSVSGIVANISFNNPYSQIPHIVVTPVGPGVNGLYIERNAGGFSIGVTSMTSGGHAFDYMVEQ